MGLWKRLTTPREEKKRLVLEAFSGLTAPVSWKAAQFDTKDAVGPNDFVCLATELEKEGLLRCEGLTAGHVSFAVTSAGLRRLGKSCQKES